METTDNQSENYRQTVRVKKENQIIFIEYEMEKDGHKFTVVDSYRNLLGRIYRQYNPQEKKTEFIFHDHEGKQLFKHENLAQLKEQIMQNKTILLEQAHDRRIEQKRKHFLNVKELPAVDFGRRKKAVEKTQIQKPTLNEKEQKQIERNIKEMERENELRLEREERLRELEELRENKDQNREQEISR